MRTLSYVARRWATPQGRTNILRWCGAVVIVVGYALLVRELWDRGLLPASIADLRAPWRRFRESGAPDDTLIPVAITVGLLLGLPAVVQAARRVQTLRPWQPHSGGGYLAPTRAPIPIPPDTWQAFSQHALLSPPPPPPGTEADPLEQPATPPPPPPGTEADPLGAARRR